MGSCIGCCCCSILCCQCNFAIFPAPSPSYSKKHPSPVILYFTNKHGHEVPYLQLTIPKPKCNLIYFHGNAEDLIYSASFLQPIQQQLSANIYSMEYPTYGTYQLAIPGRISDLIKQNSLEFYDHLVATKKPVINSMNTIVVGRSIGSGGATYLAVHKNIKNLALISPFSNIPKVASDFAGFAGRLLVKNHFDNIAMIQKYNGRLLVIHGKMDEVIAFRHGLQVVQTFQKKSLHQQPPQQNPNQYRPPSSSSSQQIENMDPSHRNTVKNQLLFVAPDHMTHNYFNFEEDILKPLFEFSCGIKIRELKDLHMKE